MVTKHARIRMQQRRIPAFMIDLLLQFGDREHDHHGAEIVYMSRRARRKAEQYLGSGGNRYLEEHANTYAVVSSDGGLVTCGHRNRHIRRH